MNENELNDLKSIIDDELHHIKVTNRLKKETLYNIFHQEKSFWLYFKSHWMKLTTVFSLFVIVLALGINFYIHNNKPQTPPFKNPTTLTECPSYQDGAGAESDNEYEPYNKEVTTTNDACPINP